MYKFKSTTAGSTLWLENIKVSFSHTNEDPSCGYYYTTNENIANAIRKSPKFGKFIFEETKAEENKKQEIAESFVAVYDDVTKTQEAISILKEKHGATGTIRSRQDLITAAEKLGVSFPKLK